MNIAGVLSASKIGCIPRVSFFSAAKYNISKNSKIATEKLGVSFIKQIYSMSQIIKLQPKQYI